MNVLNYNIKWSYRHIPIITYCNIYSNNLPFPISNGEAHCHYKDPFCKDTGRKLSLTRALKNGLFPKEVRKTIWEAYRNSKKGGRW